MYMGQQPSTFMGQSFIEKEARPNPTKILQGAKGLYANMRKGSPKEGVEKTVGRFVNKPADSAINPNNLNVFSPEKVEAEALKRVKKEGTSSITADASLGLFKKVFPGSREGIENFVASSKNKLTDLSTKAATPLAGKNPDSMRGKIFSKKTYDQVGTHQNPDGSLSKVVTQNRTPSLFAPVENTVKFSTPFLATAYVADKLYPDLGENSNQTTYDLEQEKLSSDYEYEEVLSSPLADGLDKRASLQKIAELEMELEKVSEYHRHSEMEKQAMAKRLEAVIFEKDRLEKEASSTQRNLLEKEAALEELRLRTIAKERSKAAVHLAEEMLEYNLIKQADFDGTVDELMECNEKTMKMYNSLVKEARNGTDSVESLSIISEYSGSDKLAKSPSYAPQGLSKRGQTIGEAARDLTK